MIINNLIMVILLIIGFILGYFFNKEFHLQVYSDKMLEIVEKELNRLKQKEKDLIRGKKYIGTVDLISRIDELEMILEKYKGE